MADIILPTEKKEKPPGSLFVHVRCNLIYLISRMLHVFQEAVYLVAIQFNISIQKIRKITLIELLVDVIK